MMQQIEKIIDNMLMVSSSSHAVSQLGKPETLENCIYYIIVDCLYIYKQIGEQTMHPPPHMNKLHHEWQGSDITEPPTCKQTTWLSLLAKLNEQYQYSEMYVMGMVYNTRKTRT